MTKIMGILNITPDSFFDKGRYYDIDQAIQRGITIFEEGADIIDIGGESTRPGAQTIAAEEELLRVVPIIKSLCRAVKIPISIDTYKPKVAAAAIEAGATFLNDVNGFQDIEMQDLALTFGCEICVMHMQGIPQTMQNNPVYPEGIIAHLIKWFDEKVNTLLKRGIKKNQIILDPGIGFGKSVDDNIKIIQNLPKLKTLGFPLLYGISRKSFMGKILQKSAAELLPATLAINTWLVNGEVDFIRVHDISAHRDMMNLLDNLDDNTLC